MRTWLACVTIALACSAPSRAEVHFNRDIRPIMADTCFRCHGPDKSSRMAGMRLDIREEALHATASGVIPIVPGDPGKSAIIQRIFETKRSRVMPPVFAHKDLTEAQKQTIRQWVAEGAKYEGHWAYQPVERPAVPDVPLTGSPDRNPIDAFIQARLGREGLTPSTEAGKRTLLRRVTLDLTGLPPSSGELAAFLNDTSPDAYEKVVDRLLTSKGYAEMRTLHWLDAVRYADTCGFHGDNAFPAWPYRDYVLRSFLENKPFDQFTREQLAGDLLPNPTREQLVASAYNRLNRTSAEGGVQPKEYLAKYGADRVRTIGSTWLGSTIGCAECHDHKFDPFLSRDFYAMKAFFADIKETGLVPDKGPDAWGSQLPLPAAGQQQRLDRLTAQIEDAQTRLDAKARQIAAAHPGWEEKLLADYEAGKLNWQVQRPLTASAANGARLTIYNDKPVDAASYSGSTLESEQEPGRGLIVASGPNPDNETYTIVMRPGPGQWTALAIQMDADESLPGVRFARGADRLVITEVDAELSGQTPRKLPFSLAESSVAFPSPEYPAMAAIDGDGKTGWGISTYGDRGSVMLAMRFQTPLKTESDSRLTVRIHHDSDYRRATTGRFRIGLSTARFPQSEMQPLHSKKGKPILGGLTTDVVKALREPAKSRTEDQKQDLLQYLEWTSPDLQAEVIDLAKLEAQRDFLDAAIPRVVVTEATTPETTRILPRGNWMDESGAIVEPAIPVFLGKLETQGRRATRLDLANWIMSPRNPLTARVFVNRLWRQFFGTGLSKSLDDFGSQGEWPTHPELLDWLASEFVDPQWHNQGTHRWDVRHLIRTIVTSHTYRQVSVSTPALEERDPGNRLLARQSRYRVDAEVVRDIALSVSGLLVKGFGGPSVRPYQPDGYLAALNFPKREYSASHGEDLYRRGVYTFWQRSFLHPSLVTFDAPTREECTVNRVTSNTPLQALELLNDPTFVEAARVFAQNILSAGGKQTENQLDWAFFRAVGRMARPEERSTLLELYRKNYARFTAHPGQADELLKVGEAPVETDLAPAKLAAMTTVARAILNMHEVITRN